MKKKIILSLCFLFTTLNANNFKNLAHSAQYGNVYAQYNLATQYKKTSHSKQDLLKAFKWYHKSAIKGHSASQYQLALMFHYGSGVRQNAELARLWFTRASKKGHPKARSVLYRFYSAKKPQYFPANRARYSSNFRR
jgi:TPR repeat protein